MFNTSIFGILTKLAERISLSGTFNVVISPPLTVMICCCKLSVYLWVKVFVVVIPSPQSITKLPSYCVPSKEKALFWVTKFASVFLNTTFA